MQVPATLSQPNTGGNVVYVTMSATPTTNKLVQIKSKTFEFEFKM